MTLLPAWASCKVYNELGQLFVDLSDDDNLDLEITDQWPGGFFEATFTLCDWPGRTPQFGYTLIVRDEVEDFTMFRGLCQKFETNYADSIKVTAIGHGNPEGSCTFKRDWGEGNQTPTNGKQIYPIGTPVIDILNGTFTLCQQIFSGDLDAVSGLQIAQETRDLQGLAPYDVWQEIVGWFAGFMTPLLWFVRETTGVPTLDMRYADLAVRLRCTYDNDTVKVTDTYDQRNSVNRTIVRYGNSKRAVSPPDFVPPQHGVLPTNNDIDKFVDANNEIRSPADAQNLADALASMFVNTRASGSITLCGADITALPPIVDAGTYPTGRLHYPAHLIQSGWVIETQDLPDYSPFVGITFSIWEHFITAVRYNFTRDEVTLTTGELHGLGDTIRRVETYLTNLAAIATYSPSQSIPEYHEAATPIYGPQALGTADLSSGYDNQIGKAVYSITDQFTDPENQLYMPFKAGVAPQTQVDYGVQANFGREADSIGLKGFIRVIPCIVLNWELYFLPPAGSTTVPTQSIRVKLYDNYPITGANQIADFTITNQQGDSDVISAGSPDHRTFAQGGKIGIEVVGIGATAINTGLPVAGSMFVIGVGGRKLYPDVGVNS